MRPQQANDKLTAVEKTLEILQAFADADQTIGTVELSRLTGIHKATASRILASLHQYGMVSQCEETKKYRLGPLAYRLGRSQSSQLIQSYADLSKFHIDRLRDILKESVCVEVWAENKTVVCYRAPYNKALDLRMADADVLPLHAPAGAKAILAFVNKDYVEGLLPRELARFTHNTVTKREDLMNRLVEFNRQGYSVDNQELHPGVYAIGVPIFGRLGKPVAAISVVLAADLMSNERESDIVRHMKSTARDIARAIKNTA